MLPLNCLFNSLLFYWKLIKLYKMYEAWGITWKLSLLFLSICFSISNLFSIKIYLETWPDESRSQRYMPKHDRFDLEFSIIFNKIAKEKKCIRALNFFFTKFGYLHCCRTFIDLFSLIVPSRVSKLRSIQFLCHFRKSTKFQRKTKN